MLLILCFISYILYIYKPDIQLYSVIRLYSVLYINIRLYSVFLLLLPLSCGDELWERIWNQTHLVVLKQGIFGDIETWYLVFYNVTISHDMARSNRWDVSETCAV